MASPGWSMGARLTYIKEGTAGSWQDVARDTTKNPVAMEIWLSERLNMCSFHGPNCECELLLHVYRQLRSSEVPCSAAYTVAVREYQRLYPESSTFSAIAAVKDALIAEPEAGIVDSV